MCNSPVALKTRALLLHTQQHRPVNAVQTAGIANGFSGNRSDVSAQRVAPMATTHHDDHDDAAQAKATSPRGARVVFRASGGPVEMENPTHARRRVMLTGKLLDQPLPVEEDEHVDKPKPLARSLLSEFDDVEDDSDCDCAFSYEGDDEEEEEEEEDVCSDATVPPPPPPRPLAPLPPFGQHSCSLLTPTKHSGLPATYFSDASLDFWFFDWDHGALGVDADDDDMDADDWWQSLFQDQPADDTSLLRDLAVFCDDVVLLPAEENTKIHEMLTESEWFSDNRQDAQALAAADTDTDTVAVLDGSVSEDRHAVLSTPQRMSTDATASFASASSGIQTCGSRICRELKLPKGSLAAVTRAAMMARDRLGVEGSDQLLVAAAAFWVAFEIPNHHKSVDTVHHASTAVDGTIARRLLDGVIHKMEAHRSLLFHDSP